MTTPDANLRMQEQDLKEQQVQELTERPSMVSAIKAWSERLSLSLLEGRSMDRIDACRG
ncbi:hypothetical protein [Enterobacter phage 04_vB_Eclo_IJM]|nr:hypothetical protein [Enterobacter phage 04_vB_Eclo_IJM]